MFRWSHIQKILCSESPMFRNICSEGSILSRSYMFRRSYIQKYLFGRFYIQKVLCSKGPTFTRSFVQKVLCWNTFPSFSFRYKNISRFFLFPSQLYYSLLLGIHASEFQSYDVLGTSYYEIPQVPGTWNPRTQVSKFCRHAWRFALCLFCKMTDWYLSFLQWYLITLLQFDCRLKNAVYWTYLNIGATDYRIFWT